MEQKENVTEQKQNNKNSYVEEEIDLLELLGYLRQKIVPIILCFIIGGVAAGLGSYYLITPKYQATSKLYMVSASADKLISLSDLNLGTSLTADYVELLSTRPIVETVIDELELNEVYSYEDFVKMMDVSNIGNTRIIKITVTSTDPQEAMNIANCMADKAIDYIPTVMETAVPNLAEEAILPTQKSSPDNVKNTAIGAFTLALVCAGIYTFLFITDDTLKDATDVEKYLGMMPLTVVPEGKLERDKK